MKSEASKSYRLVTSQRRRYERPSLSKSPLVLQAVTADPGQMSGGFK